MRARYLSRFTLIVSALLAGLVWWAYAPGLHGGFLFDDFGSLPALGATGPVTHWPTFWRYITSGTADPTGRPLALLTFLVDAHNWPAAPYPFKRTNLILHLLNGALLFALLARLGEGLNVDPLRARTASILGSALWLLHPLLVSTTLYIVQREAMLAATCTLAGLLLWLHGRRLLTVGQLKAGAVWSALGLGGFTALGTLAKANGSLLPLYALIIEIIVWAPRWPQPAGSARRTHQAVVISLGLIPSVAIVAYVLWTAAHGLWVGGFAEARSWSIGQRLMTEPRVLIDYLQLLWLPRPFSSGLFNDQYIASTSWLHPASTLPAALAVMALIVVAWWQRRRHPTLALAILFYFTGQLLESSAIPLELYFEHRNYSPALLMFWPLGIWLADTRQLRWIKTALIMILPLALASMTHARATVWGNVQTQGLIWAQINPASPRARANAAEITMHRGHPQEAARELVDLLAAQPNQAQLAFNLINARCLGGAISPSDLNSTRKAMLHTDSSGKLFVRWFEQVLPLATTGACKGLTTSDLLSLIDAASKNPKLQAAGQQQDMLYLRALVALARHDPDAALTNFVNALDLLPRPGVALKAAATLGRHGYPQQGLKLLDHYRHLPAQDVPFSPHMATLHRWVLHRQDYWQEEVTRLHDELSAAAQASSANTMHPMPQPIATD